MCGAILNSQSQYRTLLLASVVLLCLWSGFQMECCAMLHILVHTAYTTLVGVHLGGGMEQTSPPPCYILFVIIKSFVICIQLGLLPYFWYLNPASLPPPEETPTCIHTPLTWHMIHSINKSTDLESNMNWRTVYWVPFADGFNWHFRSQHQLKDPLIICTH